MNTETIPFGLRRYPLLMVMFIGGGIGFLLWSSFVDAPMFLFPLGRVDAATARYALLAVGVCAFAYAALVSWLRYVRRPVVVLAEHEVTIPVGEFGLSTVTVRRGEVTDVHEGGAQLGTSAAVAHNPGHRPGIRKQTPGVVAPVWLAAPPPPQRKRSASPRLLPFFLTDAP